MYRRGIGHRLKALSLLLAATTLGVGCAEGPKATETSAEQPETDQVVILLATVQALEDNQQYPAGEYHRVNIFVRSEDRQRATQIAAAELEVQDLRLVAIARTGMASPERIRSGTSPAVQGAYEDALRTGFSAVVFEEPIDPGEVEDTRPSPPGS